MSARFHQQALKAVFERAPIIDIADAAPKSDAPTAGAAKTDIASSRDLADILLAHGRMSLSDADRARALAASSGRSLVAALARLRSATAADVQIGQAISEGLVRDDEAAFRLDASLIVVRRPRTAEAEHFRLLRTRLLTTQKPERLKGISIAAVGAGVRGEFVAANLAAAFARLKRRTLIIDADLRRPSLARVFAAAAGPGLCELTSGLAAFDEALVATPIDGLDLMPAGRAPLDPQALLAATAFADALARARRDYDIVLILTAPFGPVSDGQFAWALARSALVVARRDVTRAADLRQMNVVLRQVGAEALGAVLTK
jgi:capsular exopolysaccharide synthesis family protein